MRHPRVKVAAAFMVGVFSGSALTVGSALLALWAAENVW